MPMLMDNWYPALSHSFTKDNLIMNAYPTITTKCGVLLQLTTMSTRSGVCALVFVSSDTMQYCNIGILDLQQLYNI